MGFLEKNRDTLSDSIVDMFKHSQDDLIRLLFHGNPSDGTNSLYKGVIKANKFREKKIHVMFFFSFNIEQRRKKMREID